MVTLTNATWKADVVVVVVNLIVGCFCWFSLLAVCLISFQTTELRDLLECDLLVAVVCDRPLLALRVSMMMMMMIQHKQMDENTVYCNKIQHFSYVLSSLLYPQIKYL